MTVERLFDAELANEIANHPEVGPSLWAAGYEFDFSDVIANRRNVFLHDDGGIAIFAWCAPRVFEIHLFFLPESRGRRALEASKRMLSWMMPEHADAVWVEPPVEQKGAIWIAQQCGFRKGEVFNHPALGPVQYMTKGLGLCRQ